MLNNKDRLFDKEGRSFAVTHNLKGNSIVEWEKQFKANEQYRLRKRKDNTLVFHEILSWHRDDSKNITLSKMEAMAREYIRQRNPKGMYVAVPHFDRNHYHVHICSSGVEYRTGKSQRLSKPALSKLKKEIQQFQIERFPELTKSIVAHGKKGRSIPSDKEYQFKLRTGRETGKEKVIGILTACLKQASSKETFLQLLKESGLKTYDRSGKIAGIIHNNYKFRFNRLGFTDDKIDELSRTETRAWRIKETRNRNVEKSHEKGLLYAIFIIIFFSGFYF